MSSRFSRLLAVLLALPAVRSSLPAQTPDIATQVAQIKSTEGYWVVRCANGDAMRFTNFVVQSVEGTTITFKPKFVMVTKASFPSGLDSAQKRIFGEMLAIANAPARDTIGVLPVSRVGPEKNAPLPNCEVLEVLRSPPDKTLYDREREWVFTNVVGGAKLGSAFENSLKKAPKTQKQVCLIRKPPAFALFPPIAPDLEAAFFDQLKQNMSSRFATVDFDLDGKASGAGTSILVFDALTESRAPADFKNKPPYRMVDAVYRVIDGESGMVKSLGRAGFPIGEKRDKDIRNVAKMFGCW